MALSRGSLTLSPARSVSLQHTLSTSDTRTNWGLHWTADFVTHPCDPDPDLCENNIPYTGTFDWFAANGDEISGTFEGDPCPTDTPEVHDHETAEVTGGTGRFANATGHFELAGQLDFTTNPPSFVLPWQGVISSVGSTRRHGEIVRWPCALQLAASTSSSDSATEQLETGANSPQDESAVADLRRK